MRAQLVADDAVDAVVEGVEGDTGADDVEDDVFLWGHCFLCFSVVIVGCGVGIIDGVSRLFVDGFSVLRAVDLSSHLFILNWPLSHVLTLE